MKWRVEQIVNNETVGVSQDFESYKDAERYLDGYIKTMETLYADTFDRSQFKIVKVNSTINDEQLVALTFGTIVLGMGLAYFIGKECAFRIATNNATANLNAILTQMPAESAKEFVRAFKSIM